MESGEWDAGLRIVFFKMLNRVIRYYIYHSCYSALYAE